jgi:hypothetical protein
MPRRAPDATTVCQRTHAAHGTHAVPSILTALGMMRFCFPSSLATDSLESNGESWSVVVECRRGVPSHGVFPNFRTSEIGCWTINWSIQVLELEIVKRCFRNNMKAHEL